MSPPTGGLGQAAQVLTRVTAFSHKPRHVLAGAKERVRRGKGVSVVWGGREAAMAAAKVRSGGWIRSSGPAAHQEMTRASLGTAERVPPTQGESPFSCSNILVPVQYFVI